ncbi:hypothetical protein [Alteromonas sp. KUL49]|uniref:hypothetical protein n=1 Tax=Alteromonas sp. KUL49 TaxID=2480798 RepID=UPI00102ED9DD|nr:hypothetical protein [Alteromonas sp. KUL49]TAP41473.1 hypothetical protein EYS00_04640 [Alteromonas sp. KUL49]
MEESSLQRLPNALGSIKTLLSKRFQALTKTRDEKDPSQSWWQAYNFSQLCYFAACSLLAIQGFWAEEVNIIVPGFIALVGLTRELLGLFHYLWSYSLGKAAILILYATTANVALAFAAMQINLITGVEPTPFVFTLGFTTVVMLPFWITVATISFFFMFMIVANLWLLLRLPFRLLGFKPAIHWEDKKHPFVTMIMRIVLIPVVMISLATVTSPYFAVTFGNIPININFLEEDVALIDNNGNISTDVSELTTPQQQAAMDEAQAINDTIGSFQATNEEKAKLIRRFIAHFLFYFESYPNSACIKTTEQRSVIIDENMVLLISPDESGEYGYKFDVTRCEPRITVEL